LLAITVNHYNKQKVEKKVTAAKVAASALVEFE
jgi:hypothetical protein